MKNVPTSFKLANSHAEVFTRYADNGETPVNIDLILKLRPDIRPELVKLPKGVKGYNGQLHDGSWKIFINEDLSYPEQRMVFGHELYHVLFNQPMEDSRDSSRLGEVRTLNEHAADQFSEELMMPTKQFKKLWKKYSHDIDRLAQTFYVPIKAVENRILTLGL